MSCQQMAFFEKRRYSYTSMLNLYFSNLQSKVSKTNFINKCTCKSNLHVQIKDIIYDKRKNHPYLNISHWNYWYRKNGNNTEVLYSIELKKDQNFIFLFFKRIATNKKNANKLKFMNKPNFKIIYLKTNLVKSEKCEHKRKYLIHLKD